MMTWFRKLRWLTQRRRREAELSEELEFHLSEEAKLREEDGEAQDAAQSAARRELGNLSLVKEDTRATWGWMILDQLTQDVRYAFRTMRSNRLFASLAIVSLGLGVPAVSGRIILPDDDRTGAPAVAVVSYALSLARFGGPANAIGQSIVIDSVPFTVIGVTPPGFFGTDPRQSPSLYLPFRTNLALGAAHPFGLRPAYSTAGNF